jgi:hypothetical protein
LEGRLDLREHEYVAIRVLQPALAAWHVERIPDLAWGMTELDQRAAGFLDVVEIELEKDGLPGCIDRLVGQADHQVGFPAAQPGPDGRGSALWNDGVLDREAEACVEPDAALDIGDVRESNE